MAAYQKLEQLYVLRVELKDGKYAGFLPRGIKYREGKIAAQIGGAEVVRFYDSLKKCHYIANITLMSLGTGEISCYSSNP